MGWGGAVYCTEGSTPEIINTIFAFNHECAIAEGSGDSDPTVSNCLFYENDECDYCNENTTPLNGAEAIDSLPEAHDNCSADPRFTDPLKADFHLLPDSPCIDSGDPDLEDGCLPPGLGTSRSDMGAWGGPGNCGWLPPELRPTPRPTPTETVALTPTPTITPTPAPPTPTPSPSVTPLSPDLNENGVVDCEDLFIFSKEWLKTKNETDFPADIIQDGLVDQRDLLQIIKVRRNGSK